MDSENKIEQSEPKEAYKRPTPTRRLQMDDVLWHDAQVVAKDMDRTPSWVIREALREYVDRHRAAKREAREQDRAGKIASKREKRDQRDRK